MFLAHKFRLYPTREQQTKLSHHFGANRWIYNYFINYSWDQYERTGKTPSHFDMCKQLPTLKQEHTWLQEVNAQSLQQSLLNLRSAFLKVMRKQGGKPRYKSRFNRQSSGYPQGAKFKDGRVRIPKIGWIKFRGLPDGAEYKGGTVTVSLNRDGRYYVSFMYERDKKEVQKTTNLLGLDLGILTLVTTSEGNKINGNDIIENYDIQEQRLESKLNKLQRRHARTKRDSNRREKARVKVAKAYSKLARFRLDMLHKLTHMLVDNNNGLAIEKLNVKGMKANLYLAPALHKVGLYELRQQCEYKSELNGKHLAVIDTFYPSSKTCNDCGHINELSLKEREWTCSQCGITHDRDLNAAKNIRDRGWRDSLTSLNIARGGNVRPDCHSDNKAVPVKREV